MIQKILLTRLAFNKELLTFVPVPFKMWDFTKVWKESHPQKVWHTIVIEESAFISPSK